jgi:hypothetical protein
MAERRTTARSYEVHLDYAFDRLRDSKLAQVYDILVPARKRLVGGRLKENTHEAGGDLRAGLLAVATRATNDREPDGGADRVCKEPGTRGTEGMGVRRRRLQRGES